VKFAPLSAKELSEVNLIPEGLYRYKVVEAQETTSQAGADMIKLKVEVYVDGRTKVVYDYLLAAMMQKLYHFCENNGFLDKYDNGTLGMIDCVGASKGLVNIATQKDKTGKYADKSGIKDYVIDGEPQKSSSKPKFEELKDDDLPF
jgi:hypothetical protein